MKLLLIVFLYSYAVSAHAVEFSQCVDDRGHQHFTTLPAASLDNNCKPKTNYHAYMLNQDYTSLENNLNLYSNIELTEEETSEPLSTVDAIKSKVSDLLDPEQALNELVESVNNRDENAATKFFNARSKAVETILSVDKPANPQVQTP